MITAVETLAGRAVAVLTSRTHNQATYDLRGCEELDQHFEALVKALRSAKLLPRGELKFNAAELHEKLLARLASDSRFAGKLAKAIASHFQADFGKLATLVLTNWDKLPQEQTALAEKGQAWVEPATKDWPAELRERLDEQLALVARQLYLFAHIWLLRRLARSLDPEKLRAVNDFPGMAFSTVLDEELEEIARRRANAAPDATPRQRAAQEAEAARIPGAGHPVARAEAANLAGLAFSGGGIRSATFNLGVLQHLGEKKLLGKFDYLSTVSGGGYIGSWLHAWIHHSDEAERKPAGLDHVQECLSPLGVPDPRDKRVAPIGFLRQFSSYLTPRKGALSADTWTMFNIWLRNIFLNLLVLTLALSAVMLTPYWLSGVEDWLAKDVADFWGLLLVPSVILIGLNLAVLEHESKLRPLRAWLGREGVILWLIVAPIFFAAWAAASSVSYHFADLNGIQKKYNPQIQDLQRRIDQSKKEAKTTESAPRDSGSKLDADLHRLDELETDLTSRHEGYYKDASLRFAAVVAMLVLVVSVTARLDRTSYSTKTRFPRLRALRAYNWIFWVCAIATGFTFVMDYLWLKFVTVRLLDTGKPLQTLTLSAPIFLCHLSMAVFLFMGLLGRRLPDDRREWIARLGAWLGICCAGWVAVCGLAAYSPPVEEFLAKFGTSGLRGVSLTGLITGISGLLSARSATSSQGTGSSMASKILTAVAPPVFVIGLLMLLSRLLDRVEVRHDPAKAFYLALGAGLMALFLSRQIDINEFSLHPFYRNRLVRCYLGGARAGERHPNSFTGFDEEDDVRLTALAPTAGYSGPYPILNTTLNVSHGEELAWQERKAESFTFTPRFCGFDVERGRATHPRTAGHPRISYGGYRPTGCYAYPNPEDRSPLQTDSGIHVGTAMAISGAAFSPNMGYETKGSRAFLMTVLDVRLGWWLGNPRRTDTWKVPGPRTGLGQLIAELTASTTDTGRYVYLSDGGHFENLGIYELVRRRCRLIVACDSEEDHAYTFGGLGNAIRKCRSDFGVEIEIDVAPLKPAPGERKTAAHCAVGKIHYPGYNGAEGPEGKLVYIKSSLTGDEPADVTQYALMVAAFPHESTADQWFDETQFESYRTLGYHVARSASAALGETGAVRLKEAIEAPEAFPKAAVSTMGAGG